MRKNEDELRPPAFKLPEEMNARLRIEQYIGKVTNLLYNDSSDPVGLANEMQKSTIVSLYAGNLKELEDSFKDHSEVPGMCNIF